MSRTSNQPSCLKSTYFEDLPAGLILWTVTFIFIFSSSIPFLGSRMSTKLLYRLAFLSLFGPFLSQAACPKTSTSGVPDCWGTPACAYVIAGDGQACKYDCCNCDGTAVPLLSTTVDSTPTVGCGAYTTVPTKNNCPTAAPSITSAKASGGSHGGVVMAVFQHPSRLVGRFL